MGDHAGHHDGIIVGVTTALKPLVESIHGLINQLANKQ